jgi:DNA-binding transcriptional ArsR family regulator
MVDILEVLLSSSARVHVLGLFLQHPDRQFYQREIERETGQPIRAVQREVERLGEAGILLRLPEGNRVFYRLDPEFPLLTELTLLFRKALGTSTVEVTGRAISIPAEPSTTRQPFPWMESPSAPSLPAALRQMQVQGEWDQAY